MSSSASSTVAKGLWVRASAAVVTAPSYRRLFGDRLPDDLGRVQHELHPAGLQRANLACEGAGGVVQVAVTVIAAQVEAPADDLAPPGRVGAPVAAPVEPDRGPVLRLDHALEIRQERAVGAAARMVGAPQDARDAALAAAFGEEEVLLLGAEIDRPGVGIRERRAVGRLELHRRTSRSTYLASTSTSRFTGSPAAGRTTSSRTGCAGSGPPRSRCR